MGAIQRLREALAASEIGPDAIAQIMAGYERISDASAKPRQAQFLAEAMRRMDALLGPERAHAIRDACACSKGGWRLKAAQQIARDYAGRPLEDKLAVLGQARYMGQPVLNPDGTITAHIGDRGGFACPCPAMSAAPADLAMPITYCYCCGGHFRFHYQIALGVPLRTVLVESSALASGRTEPCRFVYAIEDAAG